MNLDAETIVGVAGVVGFVVSEIIGVNPKWKSNSICQLVVVILKTLAKK